MLIKFSTPDPLFEQKVELLKLQFKTGASSKTVRKAVENYYEIDRKCERLEAEINHLRLLLDIRVAIKALK